MQNSCGPGPLVLPRCSREANCLESRLPRKLGIQFRISPGRVFPAAAIHSLETRQACSVGTLEPGRTGCRSSQNERTGGSNCLGRLSLSRIRFLEKSELFLCFRSFTRSRTVFRDSLIPATLPNITEEEPSWQLAKIRRNYTGLEVTHPPFFSDPLHCCGLMTMCCGKVPDQRSEKTPVATKMVRPPTNTCPTSLPVKRAETFILDGRRISMPCSRIASRPLSCRP